jgi:hypothetical protein
VSAGNAQVIVAFVAPPDGGSAIAHYTATCTSSDGGVTQSQAGNASPLTVVGLSNGKTYACSVVATNANGDGLASPPSVGVVPSTVPSAGPPPGVIPGNARISVLFSAPSDGGSTATSYTAGCVSSDGGAPALKTGVASPLVVQGLSNGKTYTCSVFATNTNGNGAPSPPSASVRPSTVPSAPVRPGVIAGNAKITVVFSTPRNGGSAINVFRATCISSNGGVTRAAASTHSPIVVSALTNGRTYSCRAQAHNVDGWGANSAASVSVIPFTRGFRLFAGDGGVFTFGEARYYGGAVGRTTSRFVAMAPTPDNGGYWLAASSGAVYAFGDAHNYGDASRSTRFPIVGMVATPSGRGYWLVASNGGIFTFGDAHYAGSAGGLKLRQPITAMVASPSGRGYLLLAADGGVFAYGDARYYGSARGKAFSTFVGIARSATGHGYWIADAAGDVYAFGDAPRLGSVDKARLRLPIMGISSTVTGRGYWLVAGDGGVFTFGNAPFFGWSRAITLRKIIRGISR